MEYMRVKVSVRLGKRGAQYGSSLAPRNAPQIQVSYKEPFICTDEFTSARGRGKRASKKWRTVHLRHRNFAG